MNIVQAAFGNTDIGAARLTRISTLSDLFGVVINLAFGIGLSASIVFVIVCGIKFATSAGDPNKKAEAGQCLTWSIIAAIVIVSFKLIPALVFNIFGLDNPETIMSL